MNNETKKALEQQELAKDQKKFEAFAAELETLSNKYGVGLNVIGGVTIFNTEDTVCRYGSEGHSPNHVYRHVLDASSGDLEANFYNKQ